MRPRTRRSSVPFWLLVLCSVAGLLHAPMAKAGVPVGTTFSPTKYTAGQPVTAFILVNQDSKGTIVEVEDHLPAGWTVIPASLDPAGGIVRGTTAQQVRWTWSVPAGQSLTFSFTATPPASASASQEFTGGFVRFSNDTSELGTAPLDRSITAAGATCTLLSCTSETGTAPVPVGTLATFSGSAQTTGCFDSVAFDWDFGDGSAHASTPNPSHGYGTAGTFSWSMTASIAGQTCLKTGTVTSIVIPAISSPGSHLYLISNSAHVTGASGSNWKSFLVIHNLGTLPALANLYFLKKGQNNSGAPGRQIEIAPGSSVGLEDVVKETFGETGASGAILIGSNRRLAVTSRTYNSLPTGTFGQYIEGYPVSQAVSGSQEVRLLQLTKSAVFRANVGFANATGSQLAVQARFFRADASSLGTRTVTLPPYGYTQEDDVFSKLGVGSVDDAYAIISSSSPAARYFVYASVIDGRTNDPVCVVPVDSSLLPAASGGLPAGMAGSVEPTPTAAAPNPEVSGPQVFDLDQSDTAAATGPTGAATVTHFAGTTGGPGADDGPRSKARFGYFRGVAVDGAGNVYVADSSNNTIRKITPAGVVSTLAGLAEEAGSADGAGSAARFNHSVGIAVDRAGTIFVADTSNHTIRKITPAGLVSTFAGLAGAVGTADGVGSAARFNQPAGIAVAADGTLTVADFLNHTIRRISPSGAVSTLAGKAGVPGSTDGTGATAAFNYPYGVAVDSGGNTYVTDSLNHTVRMITPGGAVTTLAGLAGNPGNADGFGTDARFRRPRGVAVDSSGTLWVADSNNHAIRRVTSRGEVTTVAGAAGAYGFADGTGASARFFRPSMVAVDASGNLLVADYNNHTVRKVTPAGVVTTVAGLAPESGATDGVGPDARFFYQTHVATDASGNTYVADSYNHTIRKVSPAGAVSTLAGLAGVPGHDDGVGSAARFNVPCGVAVDRDGSLWVADAENQTIRRVSPTGAVTTVAGQPEIPGSADGLGSSASFNEPAAIAADAAGNAWVADSSNHTVRKVSPAGAVTTVAGLAGSPGSADGLNTSARFNSPWGIAVRGDGVVVVADTDNFTIRAVTPAGVVTTLAGVAGTAGSRDGLGGAALFNAPFGVAPQPDGTVWVADVDDNTIRSVSAEGLVRTIAGRSGVAGSANGPGLDSRFDGLQGIALDPAGDLIVADGLSHRFRKVTFARCTLTCTAGASPASGTAPLQVRLTASASPSECSGTVAYDWDFGDTTAHSTEPSPLHAFTHVGSYTWTVTASVDGVSCTKTGSVTVQPGCAAPPAPLLAAPGTAPNGVSYALSWTGTSPDNSYELQEATSSDFSGASSRGITGASTETVHTVSTSTTFFARVRAIDVCGGTTYHSTWSAAAATVISPQQPSGEPLYLPAAAHLGGAAGTNWRTNLEIHNPGSAPATFTLAMLKRDQDNHSPASRELALDPGRGMRIPDVLGNSAFGFEFSGAATLRITPSSGTVMASARSLNDQPTGTFGQFIPGQAQGNAIAYGKEALLVQLAHSVTSAVLFRTNLGLVNVTAQTIQVEARLFKSDGTLLGTRTYQLRPYEYIQRDRVYSEVTTKDVPLGFAILRTTTPGGAFIAYASVIDNRTGDPIYIPARAMEP